MEEDMEYGITLCGIKCPGCGSCVFIKSEVGTQDFKCPVCGHEDVLTIEEA